jgi:hypothetical protein
MPYFTESITFISLISISNLEMSFNIIFDNLFLILNTNTLDLFYLLVY